MAWQSAYISCFHSIMADFCQHPGQISHSSQILFPASWADFTFTPYFLPQYPGQISHSPPVLFPSIQGRWDIHPQADAEGEFLFPEQSLSPLGAHHRCPESSPSAPLPPNPLGSIRRCRAQQPVPIPGTALQRHPTQRTHLEIQCHPGKLLNPHLSKQETRAAGRGAGCAAQNLLPAAVACAPGSARSPRAAACGTETGQCWKGSLRG